jgi:hypothetical protein
MTLLVGKRSTADGFSGGCLPNCLAVEEIQLHRLRGFAFKLRAEHLSIPLGTQLLEQRSSVLKVGRVEALGKPIVDFGEPRARLVAAIGVAQQSSETGRRAQLPGLRTLMACHFDGFSEVLFGL